MTRILGYSLAVCGLLAASVGCSQGASVKTIPVRGKVTFKQAPLAGATVAFVAESTASDPKAGVKVNAASGVTKDDGSYSISTVVGSQVIEGVPAGKYKVTITKRPAAPGGPGAGLEGLSPEQLQQKMQGMSPEEMMKMGGAPPTAQDGASQSEIPERYSKPDESGLTSTVGPNGAEPANFDLTE